MRKRHVSITFDFAGRQVIEAPEIDEEELVLQSLKRPEPAAAGGVELARSDDIKCDTGLNPSLLSSANLSGRAQEIYLLMKQKIQNGADKAVVRVTPVVRVAPGRTGRGIRQARTGY